MCENEMTHISRAAVKCPAEANLFAEAHFIGLLYDTCYNLFHIVNERAPVCALLFSLIRV